MADMNINLEAGIHAEIDGGDRNTLPYTPAILDPMTKSYSTYAPLNYYNLSIRAVSGLRDAVILNNGKNSRFTAGGKGHCDVELTVEDELGNSDKHTIRIYVG